MTQFGQVFCTRDIDIQIGVTVNVPEQSEIVLFTVMQPDFKTLFIDGTAVLFHFADDPDDLIFEQLHALQIFSGQSGGQEVFNLPDLPGVRFGSGSDFTRMIVGHSRGIEMFPNFRFAKEVPR